MSEVVKMKKLLGLISFIICLLVCQAAYANDLQDVILDAVNKGETSIDISECGATVETAEEVFTDMFNSMPEMCYLNGSVEYVYNDDLATEIVVEYIEDENKADENTVAAEIESSAMQQGDDISKVEYVYNYLIDNTEYDHNHTNTTTYDLLVGGKGTCIAYSFTFKKIMNDMNIPCEVVIESDNSHAWNVVQIDGEWYNVDVAWGENYAAKGADASIFFMKSDATFKTSDHSSWTSAHECENDL